MQKAGQFMKYEEVIEVISINPALDSITGKALYQVVFGIYGKVKINIISHPSNSEGSSNKLIIYIPKEKECQYKVGSLWSISVSDAGSISLVKAKKEVK